MDAQRPSTPHRAAKRSANVLTTLCSRSGNDVGVFQPLPSDILAFMSRVWAANDATCGPAKRGLEDGRRKHDGRWEPVVDMSPPIHEWDY